MLNRKSLTIRPLHPECRIQLIDITLQINLLSVNNSICNTSTDSIIDLVTKFDQILENLIVQQEKNENKIIKNLLQEKNRIFDYLGIAITYQRLSNLLVSQVFILSILFLFYLLIDKFID